MGNRIISIGINKVPDGVIGDFKQSNSANYLFQDCVLLSKIKAMSNTTQGARILKKSIKHVSGSIYDVTFVAEPEKHYRVNLKDASNKRKFASGDPDVQLFQLAMFKRNGRTKQIGNDEKLLTGYNTVNGCAFADNDLTPQVETFGDIKATKDPSSAPYNAKNKILEILKNAKEHPDQYALECGFGKNIKSKFISTKFTLLEHEYSFKVLPDERIEVTDPSDTSKKVILKKEEFLNTAMSVFYDKFVEK